MISPDFQSKAPLVLPASALGGMLAVRASGHDDNGLSSKIIEMMVELK